MNVLRQFVLHEELPSSIMVSTPGSSRVFALGKGQIASFTRVPKGFVEVKRGVWRQLVDVEMPEWLARDRECL